MGRKRTSAWIVSCLGSCCSPNFWTIQSFSVLSTVFFKCEHPFIDKLMVITEPVEPSARQLRLCSKLHVYPSNVQRMLHTNLPRFMQNLSQVCQNRVSKRKLGLLAGCQLTSLIFSQWLLLKIKNAYSTVSLPVFDTAVVCDYSVMVLLHSCLIKSVFLCQRCTYWSITVEDLWEKKLTLNLKFEINK